MQEEGKRMNAELLHRRRMMQAAGGGLPSIYQQVEYLESNGSQYINTGFVFSSINRQFHLEWMNISTATTYSRVCGAYNYNGGISINELGINNFGGTIESGGNAVYASRIRMLDNYIHFADVSFSDSALLSYNIDGAQRGTRQLVSTRILNGYTYSIFACTMNNQGTPLSEGASYIANAIRIYTLRISEYDIPKVELIPCYNKALEAQGDYFNSRGFYDLIRRQFYINNGSGNFIKGADVN